MDENSLKFRAEQADRVAVINSITDCISLVELNLNDACNRKCFFCPRSTDKFKNTKSYASKKTLMKIRDRLLEINYKGDIEISGFSEPLLYRYISSAVTIFNSLKVDINIITNGDIITADIIRRLSRRGVKKFLVNCYDSEEQCQHIQNIFNNANLQDSLIMRKNYEVTTDNIYLNNRAGNIDLEFPKRVLNRCYVPFYKMIIDHDGSYLLCAQDWSRITKKHNIFTTSISEYLNSTHVVEYFKNLIAGKRTGLCDGCNVVGTFFGKPMFDFISDVYKIDRTDSSP